MALENEGQEAPVQEEKPAAEEVLKPAVEDDDEFDDVDLSFLNTEKEKETAGEETPAEEKPVEEVPPAPSPAPETPAQQPAPQPEPQVPQATPVQEQPQVQDPGAGAAAAAEYRRVALEKLEEHFVLSEEDAEAVRAEPEKVLPKFAARVLLEAVQIATQAVLSHVPQVLNAQEAQRSVAKQAEGKFFEAWPQLRGQEQVIAQHAQFYRQMNPQAKIDDVIRDVGASVSVALRIPAQQEAQPTVQTRPGVSQIPPHKPAAAAAPRALAPAEPENIFSQMADEYMRGEDDF